MKLSSFDLSWYARWPVRHTALEEWSRPGLTNFLGSLQATGDVTSIRHVVFPPVSGAEESTAFLTLDNTFLSATSTVTEIAWCPWAVTRRCEHAGWQVESQLAMAPGEHAAVQRTTITSLHAAPAKLRIALRLSGRCVNRGLERWWWAIPAVQTTVADLHGHAGLDPIITLVADGAGKLFQERPDPAPPAGSPVGRAYHAQVLHPRPDRWLANGDAAWDVTLAPGESFSFTLALALDETPAAADLAARLAADADRVFAAAEAEWRALWRSAFSDTEPLSGSLPDLELPDELAPVAASAVLCALQSRRTHRANAGRAFYNISTPRRVEACYYTNDWGLAGHLLARLDPEATWRQFEMALRADVRRHNQINHFNGRGAKANTPFSAPEDGGADWPYTIDVFNLFFTGWELWQASGAPLDQLARPLVKPDGSTTTLLGFFEDFATDWRARRDPRSGLGDYGPKEHLLECVSTYAHVVAALNAGAAWMLLRLAEIYRRLGRTADAASATHEADTLVSLLIEKLYVRGAGYFRALRPDGRAHEVRHCWDTGMVLACVGDRLPPDVIAEVVDFFQRELQTPGWMRALSPHDGDAAVSGVRADHQYNGAYGAWPAQVALGLLRVGRRDLVSPWLAGIARTARQGPFGQAHYDEAVVPATHGGATKVTEEMPQGCHWSNLSGGLFFETMHRWADTAR